jgi:hypothetical protein
MILIDTVYQKVLALANKEQRGYITPQEFNLLADKAQLEIFESYFNLDSRKLDKNILDGDDLDMLPEKIHIFYREESVSTSSQVLNLPTLLHKLRYIRLSGNMLTELSREEILYVENNPLTKATTTRQTFVRDVGVPSTNGSPTGLTVKIYPAPTTSTSYTVGYWTHPEATPSWGYVVVNGKALHNVNTTTNFELHESEEEMLVTRILELSGIIIEKPQLQQTAAVEKAQLKQEQIR